MKFDFQKSCSSNTRELSDREAAVATASHPTEGQMQ